MREDLTPGRSVRFGRSTVPLVFKGFGHDGMAVVTLNAPESKEHGRDYLVPARRLIVQPEPA